MDVVDFIDARDGSAFPGEDDDEVGSEDEERKVDKLYALKCAIVASRGIDPAENGSGSKIPPKDAIVSF